MKKKNEAKIVYVEESLHKEIRIMAAKSDMTIQDVTCMLLKKALGKA